MRAFGVLSLSVVMCGAVLGGCPRAALAVPPNVILVMTDDQGYGDLSANGNPVLRTPNLDQLAAQSIRLTDFHVAPMCTPTRGQLMSGRDALANGAMNIASGRAILRKSIPTMANFFAGAGYRTALFGKWHLGENYPYRPQDRGFEETLTFPSSHMSSAPDYWNNDYFDDFYRHNGQLTQYPGYSTDVFFGEAMRWIAERASGEPFFAYIAPNAPHSPLFVPQQYRDPYAGLPHEQASFYGMIANIDENMGKLEQMLIELGLRDNTIVIFLTDNGTNYGDEIFNAGMRGKKTSLYEGGHRVPFFIRWPAGGLRNPGEIGELAQAQDVLPTLIELAELPIPEGTIFDGMSLASLLRGHEETLPDRTLVVQYSRPNAPTPYKWDAAVLWKRWRLINNTSLYDLSTDPRQTRNVMTRYPDVVAQMRSHYEAWWAGIASTVNTLSRLTIGSDAANPVLLAPSEWRNVLLNQQYEVRTAPVKNGVWKVEVARGATYQFELRRWPVEGDTEITAGLPPYEAMDGTYVEGKALPIAYARLKVAKFDRTVPVSATDKVISFTLNLPAGPTDLQTWFLDANRKLLTGAYYVYVIRL